MAGGLAGAIVACAFADWRLPVEGSVARPRAFSLAELKSLPPRTQITRHSCEEGWSAIGKWTGVPLAAVLAAVAVLPSARFVLFRAYDGYAAASTCSTRVTRRRSSRTG